MDNMIEGLILALGSAKKITYTLIFTGILFSAFYFLVRMVMGFRGDLGNLDIIKFGTPIKRRHREIGKITIEDMGRDRDMMKELVKKAKKIGAHGVIILPPPKIAYDFKLEGIAIKYI